MATIEKQDGLLVDVSTNPPTLCGYVMRFEGHGDFAPGGRLDGLSLDEIATHNRRLGELEWAAMLAAGCGVLYLTQGGRYVSQWSGGQAVKVDWLRVSDHNMAGRGGRRDVWFTIEGQTWHGVNIGDAQICRVRRVKGR